MSEQRCSYCNRIMESGFTYGGYSWVECPRFNGFIGFLSWIRHRGVLVHDIKIVGRAP